MNNWMLRHHERRILRKAGYWPDFCDHLAQHIRKKGIRSDKVRRPAMALGTAVSWRRTNSSCDPLTSRIPARWRHSRDPLSRQRQAAFSFIFLITTEFSAYIVHDDWWKVNRATISAPSVRQ